jgi:hypothetical protein
VALVFSYLDLLGILYFPLLMYFGQQVVQKNSNHFLYRKYFMTGLRYKLIASVFFYFVYVFYYKGGDSCNFFAIGKALNMHMLTRDFFGGLNLIFSNTTPKNGYFPLPLILDVNAYESLYLLRDVTSMMIGRIASIFGLLGLNSYMCTGLIFSYVSYLMIFRVFVMFCELYPTRHKEFSFSFLKILSVLFWGSHVSKDTVSLALLCLIIYLMHRIFIQFKVSPVNIIGLIVSVIIVFIVKNYVLIAALPGMVYWIMKSAQQRAFSGILSKLFAPIMIAMAGGVVFLLYGSLAQNFEQLSSEELEKKAAGFQSWHQTIQENQGGSGYTLGADLDYSPASIIRYAPQAIAITLFGPFPWQARNLIMTLSALEALYFLYLFLNAMFRRGGTARILKALDDPVMFFCLTFVLIMGIAIGLTSFNYGALVRYRIPLMPFFSVLLILLSGEKVLKKKKKPLLILENQ